MFMCVYSVPHGSASPFIINMDRMPAVIRRNPVRTHTQHRHVPGKESSSITQLLQTWTHVNVTRRIVNKHFSWSWGGLWRAALISNIIYLLIPRVGYTHTQTDTVTEILPILPSRSDDQPHSFFLFSPTLFLSPEIDGVFCHPTLHFMQYSSEETSSSHTQWIFINSVWGKFCK